MKHTNIIRKTCLVGFKPSWLMALVLAGLLAGNTYSATHTITSLPYTVPAHSSDQWDTLVISGTKLTSQKNGIIFGSNKSYWVVKLDDDTLEFGVDISDTTHPLNYWTTAAGIYFSSGCSNIIIEGGYILHTPKDANGNPINTSTPYDTLFAGRGYNHCIIAREFPNKLTVRNVREARIRGIGGFNFTSSVMMFRGKNVLISNCNFYNDITAFRSRCNFESTVIRYDAPPSTLGVNDLYHFRIENSYIESNSHTAIFATGDGGVHDSKSFAGQIEGCRIQIDTRNDQYPTFAGTCFSVTNGYGIYYRSAGPGSFVRNNRITSGDKNNGGRGMLLLFSNGTADNPVDISGNYMDIHEGSTVEHTPTYYVSALKLRQQNHYVNIHDNVFITTLDTSSASMQGYTYMGSAVTIQLAFSRRDVSEPPYHITFENNVCSTKVVTPVGSRFEASAVKFESSSGLTKIDPTFVWKGNRLYSNGNHIYDFGQFDDAGQYVFIQEDTVFLDNSKGLADGTYNVGFYLGSVGNISRDIVYEGVASDKDIVNIYRSFPSNNGSNELELTLERTMRMLVRGGQVVDTVRPIINAACSLFTAQGQLVLAGVSDSGGMVSGPVAYFKSADVAGDTDYNPFTLRAWSGSDFTEHTGFMIDWTDPGGTDTLTLLNTTGTGEWGKGGGGTIGTLDTIPPAKIRITRLGALPGMSPGSIRMAWTATGDDGVIGQANHYKIVYSANTITAGNFDQATLFSTPPLPSPSGQTDSVIFNNLNSGQLYYFAIKAFDEVGNVSPFSTASGVTSDSVQGALDTIPPAKISINRFGFLPGMSPGSIRMAWTSTGDDGNIGQANHYRIVYSTGLITEGNFNQATEISVPPLPSPAGQTDSLIISNLISGQLYHIAIKAYDEAGNASPLADSNGFAEGIPIPALSSDTIILDPNAGTATLFASTVISSYSIVYDFELATGSDFSTAQRQTITPTDTLVSATFIGLDSTTFYSWRVRAVASNLSDSSAWSVSQTFSISGGIAASTPVTTAYAYPNPVRFTEGEVVTFVLPGQLDDLVIYTISGDQVHYARNVSGQYIWNGRNDSGTPVASGVYLWFTRRGGQKGKIVVVS